MCLAYRALAQKQGSELQQIRALYARLAGDGFPTGQQFLEIYTKLDALMFPPAPPDDDVTGLDERFKDWGENWHAEVAVTYGPDDWVTAVEAGELIHLAKNTINRLRTRGRISGKLVKNPGDSGSGKWYYKVSDVYALSSTMRGRAWRKTEKTDTVPDSGRSDGE